MTKRTTITEDMMKGAAVATNTAEKNRMDWRTVENIDFTPYYKIRLTKKETKNVKGEDKDVYQVAIEGYEFEKAIFARVYDNGSVEGRLRFELADIKAKNYAGKYVNIFEFNKEFKKFVNKVFFGHYPNAVLEGFNRNAIYRNGLSVDVNELVQGLDFYGVNKLNKAGTWNVCGSAYVSFRLGKLKKVAILDSVNSKTPYMNLCDHPYDATVSFKERGYNVVLSKTVKDIILGTLIANGEIKLHEHKTGENYVNVYQSILTGIKIGDVDDEELVDIKEAIDSAEQTADELSALTVKELKAICKDNGVSVGSKDKKDVIISKLEAAMTKDVEEVEETQEDSSQVEDSNENAMDYL